MRLRKFHVKAFRCIHDSTLVPVSDAVALIGKNESGKTTLLEALAHLNKDYPIDDKDICDDLIDDLAPTDRIVTGYFELTEQEKAIISQNFPELPPISEVIIFRAKNSQSVEYDFSSVKFPKRFSVIEGAKPAFMAALKKLVDAVFPAVDTLFSDETDLTVQKTKRSAVHSGFSPLFGAVEKCQPFEHKNVEAAFSKLSTEIQKQFKGTKLVQVELDLLRKAFKNVFVLEDIPKRLATFFIEKLHPKLIFFPEYKIIDGIISVPEYLTSLDVPVKRSDTGYQFQKAETIKNLFHLAHLDPKALSELASNPSRLNSEQVRCSQRITNMLALTWKGKKIDVRLNLSAQTVIVEVSDIYDDGTSKNKGLLDRRSAGFKWHFSFFVNFRAGIQQAAFKDAILLLDEPGLNLHPEQQSGMLEVIRELSDSNQVLYTTHSPFLIHNFETGSLLTVEFDRETKASTIRTNFWQGEWQTIRPILHSIGDKLLLRMLDGNRLGPVMLIVEGETDQNYLLAFSAALSGDGEDKLADAEPIPAGGHVQVKERTLHYFNVRRRRVVALFDNESDALNQAQELKKAGFPENQIVSLNLGRAEADIEDIFTEDDYLKAVNLYYSNKLKSAKGFHPLKKVDLESGNGVGSGERIVKKLEKLFSAHQADGWGKFDKTGVCETFCKEFADGKGGFKASLKTNEQFGSVLGSIRAAVYKALEQPKAASRPIAESPAKSKTHLADAALDSAQARPVRSAPAA